MKTSYSARKIEERELQKLADTAGDMEAIFTKSAEIHLMKLSPFSSLPKNEWKTRPSLHFPIEYTANYQDASTKSET
jgi:hypothetical protein